MIKKTIIFSPNILICNHNLFSITGKSCKVEDWTLIVKEEDKRKVISLSDL